MNQENEAVSLSPAERKALKASAHHLKPVLMIGDAGLSDTVMAEAQRALLAHGLIKVRVLGDDRARREALMRELCAALGCAPVQMIGKLLVVYRPREGVDEGGAPSASALRRRRGPHRPKKVLGARTESGTGKAAPGRAPAERKRKETSARPAKATSARSPKATSARAARATSARSPKATSSWAAKPASARSAKATSARPAKPASARAARSPSAGPAKLGPGRPARPASPGRGSSDSARTADGARRSPKIAGSRLRSGVRSLVADPNAAAPPARGKPAGTQAAKRSPGPAQASLRDRAPAKTPSIRRGITMVTPVKKSLSDKTAGKRTDLHATEKPPARKGRPTEASQGPTHLQGKPGPRTGGRRDRAKGGKG